jgi:dimeric dUTPase (all-alpha-NTP-PPase superfamily)
MAFIVKESRTTPYIQIDKGEITIKGRSIPEDAFEFFDPVLKACREYVEKPAKNTIISIHLDYVNSGSKKYLTNILTVFEKNYLEGNGYEVNWKYDEDDEAMLDLGHDLKSIIKIPMVIIKAE